MKYHLIAIAALSALCSCCASVPFNNAPYPTSTTETITRTTVVAPPSFQSVPVSTPSIYQAPPQILQAPPVQVPAPCYQPMQAAPCQTYQSAPCQQYQSAPCQNYQAQPAYDPCAPGYNLQFQAPTPRYTIALPPAPPPQYTIALPQDVRAQENKTASTPCKE